MKKEGKNPIYLTHSDPVAHGHMNQEISNYLIEAAKKGLHSYNVPLGDFKESVRKWEKKYRGIEYSPEDIIPSSGVAGALMIVHYSVLDQGAQDEVVVFNPSHYAWTPRDVVECLGGKMVFVPMVESEYWRPDLEALRKSITDRTKYIVLSVNNPTGNAFEEPKIKEIVNIAGENNVMILSDEMYGMLAYDGVNYPSVASIAGDVPVITVNGMSKFFMRTGWRVGYIAFHDPENKIVEVRHAANMYNRLYGHNAARTTPIIYAAARAYASEYQGGFELLEKCHSLRGYTMKRLNEMEGLSCFKPKTGFYVFPRVHGIGKIWKSDEEFMTELNKEEALLFCLGESFGPAGFGHFRSTFDQSKKITEEAWDRLERFLKKRNQ
jgi:aspartate/methionine/tyrosine aminotransferase